MKSRRIRVIRYDTGFENAFKKLPQDIKQKATERETWFRQDAHDSRLRTHSLGGRLKGLWAYSISHKPAYRIVFEFTGSDEVLFVDAGKHDAVCR